MIINLRQFDVNDSGKISAEEIRAVLSKKHRFITRDEVDELVRKADKNNDGLISIDEFADFLNL
jgi:Ca2+-binding EF-hand superfamily protein